VIDAGEGIPPGERERVFLPFRRLHDATSVSARACGEAKGSGAGLGLALVRQIVRLHGGEAVATARPDAKSCIVVTLPAAG
jgi:two-component system, OmpR family, sensor histidine kinase RstB